MAKFSCTCPKKPDGKPDRSVAGMLRETGPCGVCDAEDYSTVTRAEVLRDKANFDEGFPREFPYSVYVRHKVLYRTSGNGVP